MAVPRILDVHGRPMRPSASSRLFGGYGFDGAGSDRQQTAAWPAMPAPSVTETAGRDRLAGRARDLIRNSGVAAGAMRKARAQTIGNGLALRSKPDAAALGADPQEALMFGREIERVWRKWAMDPSNQCDITRRRNFGQIMRSFWSERFTSGENIGVIRWRPDRGTAFATCIQEIDPDRLSNPQDRADEDWLSQGIELSEDGEPLAYHFRDAHRFDYRWSAKRWSWTRLPRVDEDGRLVVIHGFDVDRSEQLRGVSPFAPILIGFRDLQRFTEAEIGAAIINATFAAFVKAGFDPVSVSDALGLDAGQMSGMGQSWQDIRASIYGEKGISIRDNQIAMLAPGDAVEINNTTRQVGAFGDFKKAFLQDFAACLGIPYMVLSEDWEGVSYSAARAALAETWRIVTEDRTAFVADTVSPIFGEVVTEAFWRGMLAEPDGWPSFEEAAGAYLHASWTGPGRGYVDPLKEAQANELMLQMGTTTLDKVCADQGQDWEEVAAQRQVERNLLAEMGLPPLDIGAVLGVPARPAEEESQTQ